MPVRPTLVLMAGDAAVMLSGLVAVDEVQMRRAGPGRPGVYQMIRGGRLQYERSDPDEHWKTYDELVAEARRYGYADADCEDLAASLAGELRATGRDPAATTYVYRTGRNMSHVVTYSPRFGYLDPSKWAGMV